MELTRLTRQRAVDAVHEALKQAILNSVMRPGERLNVEELADKLGVSLTPVRHAIQLLAAEGLVEVRPRSGTFVASVTARDVEETFEIRCALECMAAEKAAQDITTKDLKLLRRLLKALGRPVRSEEDQKEHERNNTEFHLTIIQAAKNKRLLEMHDALHANIKIARIHASDVEWPTRLDQEQAEHEEIVDALEKKLTARLVKAMRKHIFRSRDSLVAALDSM